MRRLRLLWSSLALATAALAFPNPDGMCLITSGTNLPEGTVNVARSYSIATSGCTAPLRFILDGGTLPPGMTLSETTGALAGQPSAAGLYAFTIRVLDPVPQVPAKTFIVRINSALQIERRILASAGAAGSSYSDQISVSGGVAPYTFALTGSLPNGLTLNPTTGAISGTVGATFTTPASFSVQVSDSSSPANTVTSAFQIVQNSTRSLATLSLPNGTQGVAYNTTLSLATGTGGSFLLANGALPGGLSLNPTTGVLSGTPSAAGSFWFTIQSRFLSGGTVSSAWRTYNVLISNLTGLQFTTGANPPRPQIGAAYRGVLSPVGGVAPFTYALTAGALPSGVVLDAATGVLHGDVASTTAPSFNATFQVTDSCGATATQAFTFTMVQRLSFSEYSVPSGMVGAAYVSSSPILFGGGSTVRFELFPFGSELPPGVTLNTSTGVFSGTPTIRGDYPYYFVARDELGGFALASASIEISAPLTFTATSPLADYAASGGGFYFAGLSVSGGTSPYTFSLDSGTLPPGITLQNFYGFLGGSTTAIGSYSFTIGVSDSFGRTASRAFTMNVVPTVAVSNGSLSNGVVGSSYSAEIVAQGAPNTFVYSVSAGTLPNGLTLDSATGVLSGIPTTAGTFSFSVRIARLDGLGTPNVRAFQVIISNPLSFLTTSPLPAAGQGVPYSAQLQATGGRATRLFTLASGSLPLGLVLNTETGVISGIPETTGSFSIPFSVTDPDGLTDLRTLTLSIGAGIQFTTIALPNGTRTTAYNQTIAATGGTGALTYSVASGTLPTGINLLSSTGTLTGTPTAANTFSFTIRATDTAGVSTTQAYTVIVAEPLAFVTTSPIPNAALNASYAQTFTVSGGRSPFAYTITNNAPPAILAMTPATGSFGGFPIVSGTYSMTVQARDADGRTVQNTFQHTVGDPPLLSGSLPPGTVGQPYAESLQFGGGLAPYVFSLVASSLPSGLTLDAATGQISGTPTVSDTTNFDVLMVDSTGLSATQGYSLQIYPILVVTPPTLPNGTAGTAYSATVSTTGAVGSVTFAVTGGALPTGITLNPNTGALTGTPTTAGSSTFTITATDSGVPRTASNTYTVTISSGFNIITTTLPAGIVGIPYSRSIQVQGNAGAATFAVTTGSLPAGLTLNSSSGLISGTPTGTGSTFTITATDPPSTTAQRSFTITISPAFTISTTSLPDGAIGTPYSTTIQTANSQGIVTFALLTGTLPTGLTLNTNTGVISGNPTANGSRTFTIRATDSDMLQADGTGPSIRNVNQISERTFTITIGNTFAISTTTLPNGNVSTPYTATLQTVNGNTPIAFAVTAGALPAGLALNASTGVISGTPTAATSSTFTITATDVEQQTAQRSLTIVIAGAFSFTTSTLPGGSIGVPYTATLQTQNSQSVVTFQLLSGQLPPGLSLNTTSGVISGTPTQNGANTFTIRATDSSPLQFLDAGKRTRAVDQIAEATFTITIGGTFAITTTSLPSGTVADPYTTTLATENAAGAVRFAVTTGTLPAGLTLTSTTSVISGTPTASGTFPITVTATDAQERTATRDLTLTILPRFVITTTSLANGTVGLAYNATILTQGAVGTASFTLLPGGSLPPGLTLNRATGVISGTPTQVGTSTFRILAEDSVNSEVRNATSSFSITVDPSLLSITTSSLQRATAGVAYTQTVEATGGISPYRWTIQTGSLPPNLTLNNTTGVLSGVVVQGGVATFTVRVTDGAGITAERPFTLETVTQLGITANIFPIEQGQFFSSPVTVFGGRPPYRVTVLSGAPPPGISFSATNATFSGTTSAASGQFSAVVQAVDSLEQVATATLLFNVAAAGPAPLGITPGSLPNGVVGIAYSAQLGTTGGAPPYSFRISQGSLPPGVTMDGAGTLSGTPALAGAFTFGVLATDGGGRSAGQLFTILVAAPAVPLAVTPETLPGGAINQSYSATLGATGGQAPYRFNLTGDLPPGVVFTSNGTLVGTPSATGTFRFTFEVTDARNTRASRNFSIAILGPVEITTASLGVAVVGTPYAAQVEAAGGTPPYTFGLGGLPGGLGGGTNGSISGTPTAAGTFPVAAEVTDARGQRAIRTLTLTVVARLTITSSPGATPVSLGQPISGAFAAAGGRPPYQWAVTSGSLPPGVGFVSSTGALSGAPTAEGSFTFGVTVTDSLQNTATGSATIRVLPPLSVNAVNLPGGVVGTAYGASVGAAGGQAPYTFSVTQGELPPGISLAADGSLAGTPTAAGGFGFTVQAADVIGNRATRAFSITIALPPVPPISFVGAPPTIQTGQQGTITVQIASAYPVPISGTLTLQFTPNANNPIDDPAVQLTSGGRQVTFTIPAGQTNAQFPLDPLRFQVGTVAGQVQLQTTFTPLGGQPTPGPTITVTIPRAAPVITAASLTPGTGGFALTVEGFSNTREVSTMTLQFNPAPGSSLETTTVTVPVTAAFNAWFNSAGSQAFGGSFRLTLPLTVTGELSAVESVVVRLTNSVGESQPFTARRN
jgi:hypothetical protein